MIDMGDKVACPVCDLARTVPDTRIALALGVALGVAFKDMSVVTNLMCAEHRMPYFVAMTKAAMMTSQPEQRTEAPKTDE